MGNDGKSTGLDGGGKIWFSSFLKDYSSNFLKFYEIEATLNDQYAPFQTLLTTHTFVCFQFLIQEFSKYNFVIDGHDR